MTEPSPPSPPPVPPVPPQPTAQPQLQPQPPPLEKPGWLARGATALSLLACYGTLIVVAGLSALGVTIAINLQVWAAAIVIFAVVAVLGVGLGARRHGVWWPLILAVLGAALVACAMYLPGRIEGIAGIAGISARVVEIAGFAALIIAAVWDWRLCKASA